MAFVGEREAGSGEQGAGSRERVAIAVCLAAGVKRPMCYLIRPDLEGSMR